MNVNRSPPHLPSGRPIVTAHPTTAGPLDLDCRCRALAPVKGDRPTRLPVAGTATPHIPRQQPPDPIHPCQEPGAAGSRCIRINARLAVAARPARRTRSRQISPTTPPYGENQ